MKLAIAAMLAACVAVTMAIDYDDGQHQQYDDGQYRNHHDGRGFDDGQYRGHDEQAQGIQPYSFNIRSGRFPGNVDRQHLESSDGHGNVRGSYSYVGPRQQIRTVDYVADGHGYHPLVHNPVQDTPAVAAAKARHSELFQKIAHEHAQIGAQRAAQGAHQGNSYHNNDRDYRDY